MIFTNAFANGRQSIEALPSILASVPSFKIPFTSSPYANQEIQSLVSVFNEKGYTTSFFHGAPNGSMGFLGLSNFLGGTNATTMENKPGYKNKPLITSVTMTPSGVL